MRLIAAFFALLLGTAAWAQDVLPVPPLSGRVIDQTSTLTPVQQAAIDGKLAAFESQAGPQIVVNLDRGDGHRHRLGLMVGVQVVAHFALHQLIDTDRSVGHSGKGVAYVENGGGMDQTADGRERPPGKPGLTRGRRAPAWRHR